MNVKEILEPTSTSYENLRNLIFFFKTVKGCTRENEEEEERLSKVAVSILPREFKKARNFFFGKMTDDSFIL